MAGTRPRRGAGWSALVRYDGLCKLLSAAGVAPISAWFLAAILRWSGDEAVSNSDLLLFFLSPQGILLIVVSATVTFAVLFVELGGLTLIAIGAGRGTRISVTRTLWFMLGRWRQLCELGLRQFLLLAALGAGVLAVGAVTKVTLLGGGDFYFYLRVKPPQYWWAVSIVAAAASVAGIMVIVLVVRWLFAVPVLLLENQNAHGAMQHSHRLVRDAGTWQILTRLAMWLVGIVVLIVLVSLSNALAVRILMRVAGLHVQWVIAAAGLMLAVEFISAIVVTFVASVTFAGLLGRLYVQRRPEVDLPSFLVIAGLDVDRRGRVRVGMCVAGAVTALLGLSASFSYAMISRIKLDGDVAVTAHRGSSRAAPENTLAALLQAIEDGADVTEIDVQQTADGVVVLLHDTDLRRVAGVNRQISAVTYGELQELDVGSWFSAEFAQERIPTLDEALEVARGRIKLNIELKISRNDRQLPAEVVRLVRQADFENECVVTSLSFDAVRQVAQLQDRLRTGLIVATHVGDVASLEVDILAVSAKLVTRDLVAQAHRAGKEVHVWTVNDPRQMLTMIHMGVDNILTSTPQVAVALRSDWRQMSDAEKSLLFVSDFLAGRL